MNLALGRGFCKVIKLNLEMHPFCREAAAPRAPSEFLTPRSPSDCYQLVGALLFVTPTQTSDVTKMPFPRVVSLITHTAEFEYNERARRKAEGAATLAALDTDFRAQKAVWRGRSLHASLLQGERERTQAELAEAVLEPPTDEDGAVEGKQANKGKQVAPSKPKGEAQLVERRGT